MMWCLLHKENTKMRAYQKTKEENPLQSKTHTKKHSLNQIISLRWRTCIVQSSTSEETLRPAPLYVQYGGNAYGGNLSSLLGTHTTQRCQQVKTQLVISEM